ncbi:phosphotransferase [Salisediminibacterium beveridgei]|uniref:Aminoglycoside phosphotransferase domain-containing protein n=1 Tax=Salisediminibacterium beveridgei TaxID=632773 RepID=A0A1D7QS22_9BACI|nr:phosphotransferase [Salisediminibacterium beveridgei]AOM81788.1 hypothetical protein BBEV_0394 [Salisediminibacterium beveridgei]
MLWFRKEQKEKKKEKVYAQIRAAQEYRRESEFELAERSLNKALKIGEEQSVVYRAFGWLFLRSGHPKRAEKSLRYSLKLDGISPEADENIGPVLIELTLKNGRPEEAWDMGMAYLKNNMNVKVLYLLTGLALKSGEANEELNEYWRAFLVVSEERAYLKKVFWIYCRTFQLNELYSDGLGVKEQLMKISDHEQIEMLHHRKALIRKVWIDGEPMFEKPLKKGSEALLRGGLFYRYMASGLSDVVPEEKREIITKVYHVFYSEFIEHKPVVKNQVFHREAVAILRRINELEIRPEYERRLGSMVHHGYVKSKRDQLPTSVEILKNHTFVRHDAELSGGLTKMQEQMERLLKDFDEAELVLSHGDFHVANILRDTVNDRLVVVDWDVSGLLPLGFDLGSYLGHLRSPVAIEQLAKLYLEESAFRAKYDWEEWRYMVALMMAVRHIPSVTDKKTGEALESSIRDHYRQLYNIVSFLTDAMR